MAQLGLFEVGQAQLGAPSSGGTGGTGGGPSIPVARQPFPVPVQTAQISANFTVTTGDEDRIVDVTLPGPITAGNVLIVAVGGQAPAPGGVADPVVTDTLGNTFTQAVWVDGAGNDRSPVGIYYSNITVGGTDTVSFKATIQYDFGTTTEPLSIMVAEYTPFGGALSVHSESSATAFNGIPLVTITDDVGNSLVTRGRNAVFNSLAVVDFIPTNLIVAAQCSAGGAAETVKPQALKIRYRTVMTDSLTHLGFFIGREIVGRPEIGLIT